MYFPFSFFQNHIVRALVPLMTSNTTPSGVVSSINNSPTAYTAYNISSLDGWQSPGSAGDWIQYKLTKPATVNSISFTIATLAGPQLIKFAGSNDNINFTTLTTHITVGSVDTNTLNFNNNRSYLYYRFTVVNAASVTFDVIQMYGY